MPQLAAVTVTGTVALPVPPLPSETVTVAVKVPAWVYVFDGFWAVEDVVSPKVHAYVSVSPSASVPVAVKAIGVPVVTLPAGVREATTVGLRLAWATTTVSDALPLPPLPSETVTLAV